MDAMARFEQQRVDWVDYAKGFCIIMVVMMHSTLGVEKATGSANWMNLLVEFARPFRMPDFFLISGLFPRARDRPQLARLSRQEGRSLFLFLRALGHDPVRRSKRRAFTPKAGQHTSSSNMRSLISNPSARSGSSIFCP